MSEKKELQQLIESNSGISEEIKDVIREIYGDIYAFMDKRNFLRWINFQNISDVAKSIIYDVCQESEDKYLDSRTLGYFKFFRDEKSQVKRKVVLKRENSKEKRVGAHETFHGLVGGLGGFSAFFGEGITEFLAKTMYNAEDKFYVDNVETIYLLISMYGMKPIRDYLTNQGASFFSRINREIVDGNTSSKKAEELAEKTQEMLDTFAIYQKMAGANEKSTRKERAETEKELLEKGRRLLIEQYVEKVKSSIDKLEYYTNGLLDIERFNTDMLNVLITAREIGVDTSFLMTQQEETTDYLIEHSHLLVGLEGEEKNRMKEALFGIIGDQFYEGYTGNKIHKIPQNKPFYRQVNSDIEEKIISFAFKEENFGDKSHFDFGRYFQILNNFAENVCSSSESLEEYLERISVSLSNFPEEFKMFCERLLCTFQDVNDLSHKSYIRDESVKIGSAKVAAVGDSKAYIIKRDKEHSLLAVDKDTGELMDIPLSAVKYKSRGLLVEELHSYDIDMAHYPDFVDGELATGNRVFRIINKKSETTSYISLSEEENTGVVLNGLLENRIDSLTDGFRELKESIIQDNLLQVLRERIKAGTYSAQKEDGTGGVFIDYNKFVMDYIKLRSFLPVDRTRIDFKFLVADLIDNSFGLNFEGNDFGNKEVPEVNSFLNSYNDFKQSIIEAMVNYSRVLENHGDPKGHRVRKNSPMYINHDIANINGLVEEHPEFIRESNRLSEQRSKGLISSILNLAKARTRTSDFNAFFSEVEKIEERNV